MRNYDPRYVTYLIMDEAIGKKYESRKKNWKKKGVCSNIQIVKTSWVHACTEMGSRVPEKNYWLHGHMFDFHMSVRSNRESKGELGAHSYKKVRNEINMKRRRLW